MVKLLLEAKAQADMDFVNHIEQLISPICAAFYEVKRGDDRDEIVKLLLDARADPSKKFGQAGKERTPLGVACERGCVKVVRSLLEARADVDCESAVVQVDRERLTIVPWILQNIFPLSKLCLTPPPPADRRGGL